MNTLQNARVYIVWYNGPNAATKWTAAQKTLVTDFIGDLGISNWWKIQKTYT
jgi:ABC-type Fe3+-hydroxamate transport system substrate-binding protein